MTEPDRIATRVAAAARGDAAAWKELYGDLLPGVWRYVASRIPRRTDVEDVVQEAFLAIVRALPGYREEGRFFGFAFTIVRQRVAEWFRARGRAPESVPADLVELISREELPPEAFARRETRALLRRALLTLSPTHREALTLKYAEGLRFADLADTLRLSEAAAKSLVIRAKNALRIAMAREVDPAPGGER